MNFLSKKDSIPDPSLPLKNKRRESFCRHYSSEFWGRPLEAMIAANYKTDDKVSAMKTAKTILESKEVLARIKYLRKLKSETSIVDDAWIKDNLVKIIETAEKDSDRIRALENLKKLILAPKTKSGKNELNITMEQTCFPFFEGCSSDSGSSTFDHLPEP